MKHSPHLETYWITFPRDPNLPMGFGVTAFSEADAFALIESHGFDEWFEGASEIRVERGVRIHDLDQSNIVPNIGPMQLRGVWYPAANVGIGAPRDAMFKRLDKEEDG